MSWAADGRDNNGLQLEKIGPFIFKFNLLPYMLKKKMAKTLIYDGLLTL